MPYCSVLGVPTVNLAFAVALVIERNSQVNGLFDPAQLL